MIRTESEYAQAKLRLTSEKVRLAKQRTQLRISGLTASEIKRVTDPIKSFYLQLQEEVQSYERLKHQKFQAIDNLRGFGEVFREQTNFHRLARKKNMCDLPRCYTSTT